MGKPIYVRYLQIIKMAYIHVIRLVYFGRITLYSSAFKQQGLITNILKMHS